MTLSSPSVGRRDPDDDESETGKSNTAAFGQFSAQDFLGGGDKLTACVNSDFAL